MKYLLIGFVKLWRLLISPLYGDVCKYYPTCSAYGLEALQRHGAVKGCWLIVRRLARCHPWSDGGFDPVPGSPLETFPVSPNDDISVRKETAEHYEVAC